MLLALLLLQEAPSAAELFARCDSEIEWLTDGVTLVDGESIGKRRGKAVTPPADVLAEARRVAAEKKRLIFWYVPRVTGTHMNRAAVVDTYLRVIAFTDPDVVALVRDAFVPVRAMADRAVSRETDVRRFAFVEPGFVFMTADGKIVHKVDRIRTFTADLVLDAMYEALGERERRPRFDDKTAVGRGRAHLAAGRMDEARNEFVTSDDPEALYHLGLIDYWSGDSDAMLDKFRLVMSRHPDSRWAWRAASNFVEDDDSLTKGPALHGFEPAFLPPAAEGLEASAKRAVEYLLRAQRDNGGWEDSRYVYCPDPQILPNVRVAITALAARALFEWRDVAPDRIDVALRSADAYLDDERKMNRGHNEEIYADAYRLMYYARRGDVHAMNDIVGELVRTQDRGGFWAHEYPNPFCTAAVVEALHQAREAGAAVDEAVLKKAAEGLKKTRGEGGRQAYASGRPSSPKDSAARSAMCELALLRAGEATREDVAAALEAYWAHVEDLERVRVCDFHADGELGGFFFYHGVFHASEAARAIEGDVRRFVEQVLAIPEPDGSFIDSHELGKSYGTAMALLVLRNGR